MKKSIKNDDKNIKLVEASRINRQRADHENLRDKQKFISLVLGKCLYASRKLSFERYTRASRTFTADELRLSVRHENLSARGERKINKNKIKSQGIGKRLITKVAMKILKQTPYKWQ